MYRVYNLWTNIVYITHNVCVNKLSTYSHKIDYDYINKKWASEDNTLFTPEAEDSDSDNKIFTFK